MSRLVELKRAVMTSLKALPSIADVQPFGKLLDSDDISRVMFNSPAAFVSVLAAPGSEPLPEGDSRTKVQVAVAIAASAKVGQPQDEVTLEAAELVYKRARWQRWGLAKIWAAENRRMEILPLPGRSGVALLAVRWEHFIVLDDADVDEVEAEIARDADAVVQPTLREVLT